MSDASAISPTAWQNFQRLIRYAKNYKLVALVALIGMLGYAAVDSFVLSQLKVLIDDGLQGQDDTFMAIAPFAVVILFTFRGIFHFLGSYCLAWIGNNVVAKIRQEIFEHVMKLPVPFHDKESTGKLISKITYDTEQVQSSVSKALLTLIQQFALVCGMLFVMFTTSWQLSSVFLLIIPVISVIVVTVSKRFRAISKNIQGAMGGVTSTAEQSFNAHKVVLSFDGQEREFNRFDEINTHNRHQRIKLIVTQNVSSSLIQVIASFGLAFVLYFANLDSIKESVTPGVFTTILFCIVNILRPLKLLTTVNADFQRSMAACSSIFDLLDQKVETDEGTRALNLASGELAFEKVNFSYYNDDNLALKNVSFSANAGETVAFVGRSGSGKSTASSLLLRFYQANTGQVLVDGHSVTDYKLKDLRKQFAYVSQQVVLFNDTIANNIAYGKPDATRAEIEDAAAKGHVVEFSKNLDDGLDTLIGENGSMLSGGQRQRIAIARAILCDAPFLILDEATSALDTESERHIQDALQTLQQNRTCIVIAHRLSTIEKADKIIVMDNGEIIEQGDHLTLIEKDGAYAQLHRLQFGE